MDKQQYDHAHHHAENLHNKVKDLIDDRSHHLGQELLELGHRIASDIRGQKNPRSIEGTIKSMINTLQSVRAHGDQIMDFRHLDMFLREYQDLQMSLRKFENY
jgi:hypothetical protein